MEVIYVDRRYNAHCITCEHFTPYAQRNVCAILESGEFVYPVKEGHCHQKGKKIVPTSVGSCYEYILATNREIIYI